MIFFTLPLRTYSALNERIHWAKRARRVKAERTAMGLAFPAGLKPPLVVRLVRIAPRILDDDNLRGALKACRDSIAAKLGIDDGSDAVHWHYGQERGKPKEFAVRVEVTPR